MAPLKRKKTQKIKVIIKQLLLISFTFFLLSSLADCQVDTSFDATTIYDKTPVELRAPSWDKVEEYKAKEDFIYDRQPRERFRFIKRFFDWIGNLVDFNFDDKTTSNIGGVMKVIAFIVKWLFILSLLGLIVFSILKILGVDTSNLFRKRPDKTYINYEVFEENIHEMNFDQLIQEAESNNQFRNAARLHYLHVLKILTDESIIKWKPDKTNKDYLAEYKALGNDKNYRQIIYLYEHIWYGEFPLSESSYSDVNLEFTSFKNAIKKPQAV